MCGTDYNKNIFRIGPEKSYKLLKEHGNIENIETNTKHDTSILKHVRVREMFRKFDELPVQAYTIKINFCGKPELSELSEFLSKRNIRYSVDTIMDAFIHENHIVFEDSDED